MKFASRVSQKMSFVATKQTCTRNHGNHDYSLHLDGLCPGNYTILKNKPTCKKCLCLLTPFVEVGHANCKRIHGSSLLCKTQHSDFLCPGNYSRYYCKCT